MIPGPVYHSDGACERIGVRGMIALLGGAVTVFLMLYINPSTSKEKWANQCINIIFLIILCCI